MRRRLLVWEFIGTEWRLAPLPLPELSGHPWNAAEQPCPSNTWSGCERLIRCRFLASPDGGLLPRRRYSEP